jgi:hypothetical protein
MLESDRYKHETRETGKKALEIPFLVLSGASPHNTSFVIDHFQVPAHTCSFQLVNGSKIQNFLLSDVDFDFRLSNAGVVFFK